MSDTFTVRLNVPLCEGVPWSSPVTRLSESPSGRKVFVGTDQVKLWEPPAALGARAAHLLPGLFLARVDGKSPVEYITTEQDRNRVRRTARALLAHPAEALGDVRQAWTEELTT